MCRVCVKCGFATTMQVQATIQALGTSYHNLQLHHPGVELLGVNWETADFICRNQSCRYVDDGMGNYVTRLRKENEELKRRLAEAGL